MYKFSVKRGKDCKIISYNCDSLESLISYVDNNSDKINFSDLKIFSDMYSFLNDNCTFWSISVKLCFTCYRIDIL